MNDHEHILKHVFQVGASDAHALQREPDELSMAGVDRARVERGLTVRRRGRRQLAGVTQQ